MGCFAENDDLRLGEAVLLDQAIQLRGVAGGQANASMRGGPA